MISSRRFFFHQHGDPAELRSPRLRALLKTADWIWLENAHTPKQQIPDLSDRFQKWWKATETPSDASTGQLRYFSVVREVSRGLQVMPVLEGPFMPDKLVITYRALEENRKYVQSFASWYNKHRQLLQEIGSMQRLREDRIASQLDELEGSVAVCVGAVHSRLLRIAQGDCAAVFPTSTYPDRQIAREQRAAIRNEFSEDMALASVVYQTAFEALSTVLGAETEKRTLTTLAAYYGDVIVSDAAISYWKLVFQRNKNSTPLDYQTFRDICSEIGCPQPIEAFRNLDSYIGTMCAQKHPDYSL